MATRSAEAIAWPCGCSGSKQTSLSSCVCSSKAAIARCRRHGAICCPPRADDAGAVRCRYALPGRHATPAHPRSKDPWQRVGAARRFALLGLVLAQTWFATSFMAAILPYHGRPPLEFALVSLFAVLFAWISAGFWTAIAGFVLLWA